MQRTAVERPVFQHDPSYAHCGVQLHTSVENRAIAPSSPAQWRRAPDVVEAGIDIQVSGSERWQHRHSAAGLLSSLLPEVDFSDWPLLNRGRERKLQQGLVETNIKTGTSNNLQRYEAALCSCCRKAISLSLVERVADDADKLFDVDGDVVVVIDPQIYFTALAAIDTDNDRHRHHTSRLVQSVRHRTRKRIDGHGGIRDMSHDNCRTHNEYTRCFPNIDNPWFMHLAMLPQGRFDGSELRF
ncbi:hypothetical protein C6Y62_09460 [Hyphomicrobium sulfonivorans]|nr:hypothetical protein [Hyphomicrobium sulfonivorans]